MIRFEIPVTRWRSAQGSYENGIWSFEFPGWEKIFRAAFSREIVTQAADPELETVRRAVAALGGKVTRVSGRPKPSPLIPGTVE